MSSELIPAFEKEFKCKVETDSAFPFMPKLQASPRSAPVYDVLHTNSNEQWNSFTEGLVMAKITPKEAPNVADVYPYAVSDKIVPLMNKLRETGDEIEVLTPHEIWPLPTYREMLFVK